MRIQVRVLGWTGICCGCGIKINPQEKTYMISDLTGISGSIHFCKNCINSISKADEDKAVDENLKAVINDILVNLNNLTVPPCDDDI